MRILLVVVIILVNSTRVFAAVTNEEVRAMGYAGDVAGLEAAFAEAHQRSLIGEISFDDLRGLVITLTTTHPTTLATTEAWLEEYPISPYANALRAFQYRTVGWNLRGGNLVGGRVPSGVNRNLSGEKRNFCRVRDQLCVFFGDL